MPAVSPYFRRKLGQPKYPGLWEGCAWAACPSVMGPCGETLFDLSGRGNHGSLSGFTLSGAVAMSGGRYSLVLPGNRYIQAASPVFQYPVSLAAWVRPTATPATVQRVLCVAQSAAVGPLLSIHINGAAFVAQAFGGGTGDAQGGTVTAGEWHHIAGVFGPSSQVLYVNGIQAAATSVAVSIAGVNEIQVGALEFATGIQYLTGNVDDLRVYGRYLSAGEIRLLAQSRGVAYDVSPPVYADPLTTTLLKQRREAVVC